MENKRIFTPHPDLKLMDQVREVLRFYHYSYATEKTYSLWIVRYLRHYKYKSHPKNMGAKDIEAYLSYLASEKKVAANTQKQALNALVFLYNKVLGIELENISHTRTKKQKRLPVVMTKKEVRLLLSHLQGNHLLMTQLMYGCGLRIMECHRLRLKDIDFGQGYIFIRDGKGGNERALPIPQSINTPLQQQIEKVILQHQNDLVNGYGSVYMPNALSRKYPNASKEVGWQYLFPSKRISSDPRSSEKRRHHVLESGLQKAIKRSTLRAGIIKKVSSHTLRHCYATHLLEDGVNIRVVQKLMGHKDVKTTEIYTHVMKKDIDGVISPLDSLIRSDK